MPEATARFAALLLAAVFAWAAVSKLLSYPRWKATLGGYGLPRAISSGAAPIVPVAELSIAILVLFATPAGAALALAGLAAFCLAILRARSISGDRLPCGCFGGATERNYRVLLWRNAALAVVAAIVLTSQLQTVGVPEAPTRSEWLPVVLIVVGAALAMWTALHVFGRSRATAPRHDEHP